MSNFSNKIYDYYLLHWKDTKKWVLRTKDSSNIKMKSLFHIEGGRPQKNDNASKIYESLFSLMTSCSWFYCARVYMHVRWHFHICSRKLCMHIYADNILCIHSHTVPSSAYIGVYACECERMCAQVHSFELTETTLKRTHSICASNYPFHGRVESGVWRTRGWISSVRFCSLTLATDYLDVFE